MSRRLDQLLDEAVPQIAGEKNLGGRYPDLATALRDAHAVAQQAGKTCRGFAERMRLVVNDEPKAFAYDLGLSLSAVYNYMNGRLPSLDVLQRIATHAGCSVSWLLGENDETADSTKKSGAA